MVLALGVGGCGEHMLKESQLETVLPRTTAQITVGQSTRAEVRRLVGAPLVSSDYWRFDLYRLSDENRQLHWYVVPMGVASERVNGYVLVAYDPHGTVAARAHGIGHDPGVTYAGLPAEADVVAGDLRFDVLEDEAFLAVGVARRDVYLRERGSPDRCRVVVGCVPSRCPARITLDGDRPLAYPTALTGLSQAVTVEELASGEHEITAAPSHFSASFAAEARFECPAGETRYVALELSPDETQGALALRSKYLAKLRVSALMPDSLRDRPLLLWANGRWRVEAEPGS